MIKSQIKQVKIKNYAKVDRNCASTTITPYFEIQYWSLGSWLSQLNVNDIMRIYNYRKYFPFEVVTNLAFIQRNID